MPKRIQVRNISVDNAVYYFLTQAYSFRGCGDYVDTGKFMHCYEEPLKATHELYQKIELSQLYYKKFMKKYLDDEKALILLDPPYLRTTRIRKNAYIFEFTERQHRYLLQELTKQVYNAKIVLCGYDSYMYNHYFALFNEKNGLVWHSLRVMRLGKRKVNQVYEHLWINFEPGSLLEAVNSKGEIMFEEVDMSEALKKQRKKSKKKKEKEQEHKQEQEQKQKHTRIHIKKATFKNNNL